MKVCNKTKLIIYINWALVVGVLVGVIVQQPLMITGLIAIQLGLLGMVVIDSFK